MSTSAQRFIADEQRKFPPPPDNNDRVAALFADLKPALPGEMSALADRGDLVIAEIGEIHPDVRTFFPDGGYAVGFTTGMLVYTDLIARFCAATFVEGAVGSPTLNIDEIKMLVTETMQTYVKQNRALWRKPPFTVCDITVPDAAADFRDKLLATTQLFMLAHELGHVAMESKVRPPVAPSEDELAADRLGLQFALPAAAEKHSVRVAIAGAGMAIRLFVSLERFGVKFSTIYPPQEDRLAALEAASRAMLESDQRADECSTVMVAILDLMDDLDDRIAGTAPATSYTESRARIGLLARLIEVASRNLSPDAFVAMIGPYAADLPADAMGRVLNALCSYYWDWIDTGGYFYAPQFLEKQTMFTQRKLIALSEALRAAVSVMPEALRVLLDRKYTTTMPA